MGRRLWDLPQNWCDNLWGRICITRLSATGIDRSHPLAHHSTALGCDRHRATHTGAIIHHSYLHRLPASGQSGGDRRHNWDFLTWVRFRRPSDTLGTTASQISLEWGLVRWGKCWNVRGDRCSYISSRSQYTGRLAKYDPRLSQLATHLAVAN